MYPICPTCGKDMKPCVQERSDDRVLQRYQCMSSKCPNNATYSEEGELVGGTMPMSSGEISPHHIGHKERVHKTFDILPGTVVLCVIDEHGKFAEVPITREFLRDVEIKPMFGMIGDDLLRVFFAL